MAQYSLSRRSLLGALGSSGVAAAALPTLEQIKADENKKWKGSELGSLYPFIKREQQKTRQTMAFLRQKPNDLQAWRSAGRAKIFELMLYRPPSCAPEAEILERVDKEDYWRERISFQTAPGVRVPAFLLLPKGAKHPAPAVIALHDHGGFYFWGKEHIVETEGEDPELTKFRPALTTG